MAKDPAVLLYTSDFLTGTMMMNDEQVGKYIRLLCVQHQKGFLTEKEMLKVCGQQDEEIFSKFEKEGQNFFNRRMRQEAEKRKSYCGSRSNNRKKGDNDNCHIYFILDEITGLVKIGSSVSPERRILELKTPENKLSLLFSTEKTSQKLETELHDRYKNFNSYLEWYDIRDILQNVKDFILSKNIHIITHIKDHMIKHMENENENENINEDRIENKKEKDFQILEIQEEAQLWPTFNDFWNEYDKKVGEKGKLQVKWEKLKQEDKEKIMLYIPEYKFSQPDKKFRLNPETFFNNKSWNDEIILSNGKQQNTKNDKPTFADVQRGYVNSSFNIAGQGDSN